MVALVVVIGLFALAARFNVRLLCTARSGTSYQIGIEAASLVVGYDTPQGAVYAPGWSVLWGDYSWLSSDAWRPYHQALAPLPKHSPHHFLIVPLWYFPIGAIGYLCFTHGVIRGMRRAALNACTRCGYDLSMMPGARADRVCPECGQRQGGSLSRRGDESTSATMVEVKLPMRDVPAASEASVPHSGHGAPGSSPSRE